MSFLDNLENNLKALESREEKDPARAREEQARQEAAREAALAAAPHAEALRHGAFTEKLLTACRTLGHQQRTLVRFTWLDTVLRLEAKENRLELHPTAVGIEAVFSFGQQELSRRLLSAEEDAEALAREWLSA